MKILLLGAKGMLGTCLFNFLTSKQQQIITFEHNILDIAKRADIFKAFEDHQDADWIINCAAYTKVDDCEVNFELAKQVNGEGPANLAIVANKLNIPLIHFSTDYVFNGLNSSPYTETDQTEPVNAYGYSKLLGEQGVIEHTAKYYIFRIQWLYGSYGVNFVETILKAAAAKPEISIVNDQYGSPTWTQAIAQVVSEFLECRPEWGIYNAANTGYASWYDFAAFFIQKAGLETKITPVSSAKFARPAKRPLNSRLCLEKLIATQIKQPDSWQIAIESYLKERNSK